MSVSEFTALVDARFLYFNSRAVFRRLVHTCKTRGDAISMTPTQRTLLAGGLLFCGLGLQQAFAITGCTNLYLQGTYNVQITNANLLSTINNINATLSTSNNGNGSTS